jgi:ubiquinone/menaquinone biosynthesis C-methylase UbiE
MGATVERLSDVFELNAYGIDPSLKLLELGREKYGDLQTTLGKGEELPYPDSFFDGVFAECSMSLMEDYRKAILESRRVLEDGGYYIISDVYARKPEHLEELQRQKVNSCMRGLFHIDEFKEALVGSGFEILSCEDWTDLLKQLMVKIIFQYGSMSVFWEMATCSSCGDFQEKLTKCKPGYFLLIARKR